MDDTRRLKELIATWLEETSGQPIHCGLEREEALSRARELLEELREGKASPQDINVEAEEDFKDVLYGLVALVTEPEGSGLESRAKDAALIARFIRQIPWPHDIFGEKDLLLQDCDEVIRKTQASDGRVIGPPVDEPPSQVMGPADSAAGGVKPLPGEVREVSRSGRSREAYSLFCENLGTIHFVLGRLYGLTRDEAAGVAHSAYEWFERLAARAISSKMPVTSLRLPLFVAICKAGQNRALEKLDAEPNRDAKKKDVLRRDPKEVAQEIERTLRDQNGQSPNRDS